MTVVPIVDNIQQPLNLDDLNLCKFISLFLSGPSGDQRFLLFGKSNPGEIRGVSLFADRDRNYSPMVPIENLQIPRAMDYYRYHHYIKNMLHTIHDSTDYSPDTKIK